MSRYPRAIWDPLPENATQPHITPKQLIVHTAVDQPGPTNLRKWFGREEVKAETHFWLPWSGPPVQMMDTNVKAHANRYADAWAISIETEDDGNPEGNPWNASQLGELILLARWLNEEHGIPLALCPGWDKPGIGWHSMWGWSDPTNLTGAIRSNPWSSSYKKTCPGKTRITQFNSFVLPALRAKEQQLVAINQNEAERTVDTAFRAIIHRTPDTGGREYWIKQLIDGKHTKESFLWAFLEGAAGEVGQFQAEIKSLLRDVAAVKLEIAQLKKTGGVPAVVDVDALTQAVARNIAERLQ